MARNFHIDESGDSDELQALFDTIAQQSTKPKLEVVSAPAEPAGSADGDNDDLQSLFDTVASDYEASHVESAAAVTGDATAAAETVGDIQEAVFQKVGLMARHLHDTLRELGYDRKLQETAKVIPDARQRLQYIAQMTEQAASRVLNATDIAKPIQDQLQAQAEILGGRWEKLFRNELTPAEFKTLAVDTRLFVQGVPAQTRATNAQLTDIMMAQDFQDLTGQVIKRVVEMAQALEQELVKLLVEVIPADRMPDKPGSLMNGPVIDASGRTDVVTTQAQVDDLLESLGF